MSETRASIEAENKRTEMDSLAKLIFKFINKQPAAARLYPDIYAEALADKIRKAGYTNGTEDSSGVQDGILADVPDPDSE